MAKFTEKLNWFPVTLTTPAAIKAFEKYEAKAEELKVARQAVEDLLMPAASKMAPKGQVPVFGFRFGKVSVAFKDPDKKSASPNAIEM